MSFKQCPCGIYSFGHKIAHVLGIHMVSRCTGYWINKEE